MSGRRLTDDPGRLAFARQVRTLLEERGLTTAETARRMREHLPEETRASRALVSHYQNARALPRGRYLDALSLALGIDKSELLPALELAAAKPTQKADEEDVLRLKATSEYADVDTQALRSALGQIPPDQRKPLVLIAEGFSYWDAAKTCGCAVGTIKSRVSRARRSLAEMLGRTHVRKPDVAR